MKLKELLAWRPTFRKRSAREEDLTEEEEVAFRKHLIENEMAFNKQLSNRYLEKYPSVKVSSLSYVSLEEMGKCMSNQQRKVTSSVDYLSNEILVFYPRMATGYNDSTIFQGAFPYTNLKDLLARFFIHTHANHGRIENWRPFCIGIASWTGERSQPHMPMFDYDGRNIKTLIRKDIEKIQEKYDLGPAWIFRTRRGFHVYFFTDLIPKDLYMQILKETKCCEGFRRSALTRGYGVLRISAKYTDFDIQLEQIIPAKNNRLRRKTRKAHLVEALLGLGQQCGTHFASMFPTWALFTEDPKPWRAPTKKRREGDQPEEYEAEAEGQAPADNPPIVVQLPDPAGAPVVLSQFVLTNNVVSNYSNTWVVTSTSNNS